MDFGVQEGESCSEDGAERIYTRIRTHNQREQSSPNDASLL